LGVDLSYGIEHPDILITCAPPRGELIVNQCATLCTAVLMRIKAYEVQPNFEPVAFVSAGF